MKSFRNLRIRLTLVCAISTGFVLAGMAAVSYNYSVLQLKEQYRESFSANFTSICSYLRAQPVISHTWLMQTEKDSGAWISIGSMDARMVYAEDDELRADLESQAMLLAKEVHGFDTSIQLYTDAWPEPIIFQMDTNDSRYRVGIASIRLDETPLTVMFIKATAQEYSQIIKLRMIFGASVLVALLCLILFSWVFTKWATKPVEENRQRQIDFVGAASHEFRSPVAVIQMGAENIKKAPPDLIQRFADAILRECSRLKRLTDDMLQLAGADSHNLLLNYTDVNPESIVLSSYEAFSSIAAEKGIAIELRLPDAPLPKILCDRERIEQTIDILLENAIQYSPKGSIVELIASLVQDNVVFGVADNGIGISDDDKPHIFERFYRADKSRSDKTHYGLGLSIATEIADLHKARLFVRDADLGGSLFELWMPIQT